MTCIAAVTDGKTVVMGGDSAAVSEFDLVVRREPKVFFNGEFLIGFTTSFRMGNLLRFTFKPPEFADERDPFEYISTDFVNALRRCFKRGGYAKKSEEVEEGGCFLVGCRGRLFQIDEDYQVGEPAEDYAAVGCGHAYAKGSLFATNWSFPDARVRYALEAAERHSCGVRSPFTILTCPPRA